MCHIIAVLLCLFAGHHHHHMPVRSNPVPPPGLPNPNDTSGFIVIPSAQKTWTFAKVGGILLPGASFITKEIRIPESTPPLGSVRELTRINISIAEDVTSAVIAEVPIQPFVFNLLRNGRRIFSQELTPNLQVASKVVGVVNVTLSQDFVTPLVVRPRENLSYNLSGKANPKVSELTLITNSEVTGSSEEGGTNFGPATETGSLLYSQRYVGD